MSVKDQENAWTDRLEGITSSLGSKPLTDAKTELESLLTEICSLPPSASLLHLQLATVFNLQVLNFYIYTSDLLPVIEKCLTGLVNRLNPSLRVANAASVRKPWDRIIRLTRNLLTLNLEMSRVELDLLLAILTSQALLSRSLSVSRELFCIGDKLRTHPVKEEGEARFTLVDILHPLNSAQDTRWSPESVYLVNLYALSLFTGEELKGLETIKTSPDFRHSESIFSLLHCLGSRLRGGRDKDLGKELDRLLATRHTNEKAVNLYAELLHGYNLCDRGLYQLAAAKFYKIMDASGDGGVEGLVGSLHLFNLSGNVKSEIATLKLLLRAVKDRRKSKSGYLGSLFSVLSPCLPLRENDYRQQLATVLLGQGRFLHAAQSFAFLLTEPDDGTESLKENQLGLAMSLCLAGKAEDGITILQQLEATFSRKRKAGADNVELLSMFLASQAYRHLEEDTRALHYLDRALACTVPTSFPSLQNKTTRLDLHLQSPGKSDDNGRLDSLMKLRSTLYLEKARVYRELGDNLSYRQSLECGVRLYSTPGLLEECRRYVEVNPKDSLTDLVGKLDISQDPGNSSSNKKNTTPTMLINATPCKKDMKTPCIINLSVKPTTATTTTYSGKKAVKPSDICLQYILNPGSICAHELSADAV